MQVKTLDKISALFQPQNYSNAQGTPAPVVSNSAEWKQNLFSDKNWQHFSCQQTTDQEFIRRGRNTVDRCRGRAVIGPPRWVFPHSAKSCQQRRNLERGLSRPCTNHRHSQRNSDPSPGSKDAVHAHQHADPTGVYPASVYGSCHAFFPLLLPPFFLRETLLSCRFRELIDLAEQHSA